MLTRARAVTGWAMAVAVAACSPQNRIFVNGSGGAGGAGSSSTTTSSSSTSSSSSSGIPACVPESDAALCTALGKSCEQVSGTDNCGTLRMADCGTCTAPEACVSNVCQAPVCADLTFGTTGTPIASVDVAAGTQNIVAAVTPTGSAMLILRGTPCGPTYTAFIADATTPGSLTYTVAKFTGPVGLDINNEEQQTLTADGLTIIATNPAGTAFVASSRSAAGMTDFGAPSGSDYANLTAGTGETLFGPAISADGLAFYYTVKGGTGPDGGAVTPIYESVRASISDPFPAGTLMPAPVTDYYYVTAVSSDRMALFVQQGFSMSVLTRTSVTQPFVNPNAPAASPILPGFRTAPVAGCKTLVGTCNGGCSNESICTYPAM